MAVHLHDCAVDVGVGGVQPDLRKVGVVYGDDECAAILQPLAVVRLTEHVRKVEERADVLDATVGKGETAPDDLVRVGVRLRLRRRLRGWLRAWLKFRVRIRVRVRVRVRVRPPPMTGSPLTIVDTTSVVSPPLLVGPLKRIVSVSLTEKLSSLLS